MKLLRPPRPFRVVWTLAALAILLPVPARSQDGPNAKAIEVLRTAAERYEAIDALCAGFHQIRRVPLLDQVTESRGRLCHKDPNLFFMEFSEPEGDRVVADGDHLWIYYPSTDPKQVFQQPMEGRGGRFDFHREFLADPGARYDPEYLRSETVDGHPTHLLRLLPRGPSSYVEARVWIDAGRHLIRKVVITEENESVREVTLSKLRVDPEIPPRAFRFTPPEGTIVIRR